MKKREQPGLSVGIVYDQDLIWAKGYGHADLERIPAGERVMAEHQEIIDYLMASFPTAQVLPPWDHVTGVASIFPVIEGHVEHQLEIARPLLDDFEGYSVVQMLRTNRVAEAMRDQPGKRVVLERDRCGELLVEINPLRKA